MYDKQIRRRRALLLLLVAVSLILLTAYFGESPSSPLHSVQRGIVEVLSPVQRGASTVLKPVRNVAGWFSDTFSAKTQRDQLRTQNQQLLAKLARLKGQDILNQQLNKQIKLSSTLGSYRPVAGQVIGRDQTVWYAKIEVDKGSGDGVHQGDPVTGDGALVGFVSTVGASFSEVTQITDQSFGAAAQVQNDLGDTGLLKPAVGDPSQLLLTGLDQHAKITAGELVVTAGIKSKSLPSLFPPNIPIGTVSDPDPLDDLVNNQQVKVSPAADLRHVEVVQILTAPQAGNARAQVGGRTSG